MPDVNPLQPRRTTLRQERAEVTRRRILGAARLRFARDGYAATTITGIALEAGVAVQTVYAVFSSKAGVLAALRDETVYDAGADAVYGAAMAEPDPAARLRLFAASIRQRWERGVDVVSIHNDAGRVDATVRAGVEMARRRRLAGLTALADSLASSRRAGLDAAAATAVLDALTMPEVYLELTGPHCWSADHYEAWLAEALVRELLADG